MKEKRICKECGKEFEPCHSTSEFCSKSCATKYRNKEKLKDGTHNFFNIDRSRIAKERVENGTHPFLSGNMSADALERKAKGISEARKQQALEHTHPWQQPKNFINNEYSRSINVSKKRGLTEAILYISDTDIEDTFKIGWTYDLEIRERDGRTRAIHNLTLIVKGSPEEIIEIEKKIKENFFNEEYFGLYGSTEIFPNSIKNDVMEFIKITFNDYPDLGSTL